MTFQLHGVTIRLSFWFFCGLTVLLLADTAGLSTLFLGAVALHEGGHLLWICLRGLPLGEVSLTPGGLVMGLKPGRVLGTGEELVLNLAGCGVNLLTAALCYFWCPGGWSLRFSAVNAALGLFNLLPIPGLDGADILRDSLVLAVGWERGTALAGGILKAVSGVGAAAAGYTLLRNGFSFPGMMFLGVFLSGLFSSAQVE